MASPGCRMAPASCLPPRRAVRLVYPPRLQSPRGVTRRTARAPADRSVTCPTCSPISSMRASSLRAAFARSRRSGAFQYQGHRLRTSRTGSVSLVRRPRCKHRPRARTAKRSPIYQTVADTPTSGSRRPTARSSRQLTLNPTRLWPLAFRSGPQPAIGSCSSERSRHGSGRVAHQPGRQRSAQVVGRRRVGIVVWRWPVALLPDVERRLHRKDVRLMAVRQFACDAMRPCPRHRLTGRLCTFPRARS